MPEISTPDWERDEERTCPGCGHTAVVSVGGYQNQTWWDCPNSGTTQIGEE